jgi:hypothetical protein
MYGPLAYLVHAHLLRPRLLDNAGGEGGKFLEEQLVRLRELHRDAVGAVGGDRLDGVEEPALGHVRVAHHLETVDDVGGGQRLAVPELDVLTQREHERRVVHVLPLAGERRCEGPIRRGAHEQVAEVEIDEAGVDAEEGRRPRVDRSRLAGGQTDGELVDVAGRLASCQRAKEGGIRRAGS